MKNILFVFLLSNLSLTAQKILIYSGPYSDEYIEKDAEGERFGGDGSGFGGARGTANYQYYETANSTRVFQGSFTLKEYPSLPPNIIGNFKNDLKDGKWSITRYNNPDASGFVPCVGMVYGNFISGKLNGLWTYSLKDKKTGKIYRSSTAHFTNNIKTGMFEFVANDREKFEIKINYDSLGDFHGTYLIKYWIRDIPYENHGEYNHGTLLSSIHRNLATGGVPSNNDPFWDLSTALDFWGCKADGYNGCIRHDNPLFIFAKGTNLNASNPLKEQAIAKVKLDQENAEAEAKLIKKETDYRSYISSADNYFSKKNYQSAITDYENASRLKKNEPYPSEKIKECKNKLAELFEIQSKYEGFIAKADNAFKKKDYDLSIVEYNNALNIKKENYPKTQIEKAKELKEEEARLLREFLIERSKTVYSLEQINRSEYFSLLQRTQDLLVEKLSVNVSKEYEYEGALTISIDTTNKVVYDIIPAENSKDKLSKEIKEVLNSINYPVQNLKGYNVNSKANISLKILMFNGSTKFLFRVRSSKGINNLEFQKNECNPAVSNAILDKYYGKIHPNVYTDKYEYLKVNEKVYFSDELKEN